jgi:hypothetical protein
LRSGKVFFEGLIQASNARVRENVTRDLEASIHAIVELWRDAKQKVRSIGC